MDNAQKFEMEQAQIKYQRNATITATNDFNLDAADQDNTKEESKR